MKSFYDVIIVGGRVAGAALGIRLARAGHKVLIVEKGRRGQDTLSTHFVSPRGAHYLERLWRSRSNFKSYAFRKIS